MAQIKVQTFSESNFAPLIDYVSHLVTKEAGIVLGDKQKTMVETRLRKRMIDLDIQCPNVYMDYIQRNFMEEKDELIGLLTTHHTFFFREFQQIETLLTHLPSMAKRLKTENRKTLNIWSAACSRGQEVYTLAMFLDYHLKEIDPTLDFKILGTDIDPQSVQLASNGVYHRQDINKIPLRYLGNHWAKGKGRIENFMKVRDTIKSKCHFEVDNLMQLKSRPEKFDLIFVRNVLIYFTETDIEKITHGLNQRLKEGGIIVCGASETLPDLNGKLQRISPLIYTNHLEGPTAANKKEANAPLTAPSPAPILKVVCVDDSKSVLKLLQKILTENEGFQVVGTAENGIEAAKVIRAQKPDLVTLDIHMPEMTGIEYLARHHTSSHPPVVMISSASRDDASTAMKALDLGACDFIEKPALTNLAQRGDEIKAKLRVAARLKNKPIQNSFDKQFSENPSLPDTNGKLLVIYGSIGRQKEIQRYLRECQPLKMPIFLVFEGQDHLDQEFAASLQDAGFNAKLWSGKDIVDKDEIYVAPFEKVISTIEGASQKKAIVVNVFGQCSPTAEKQISRMKNCEVITEDLGAKTPQFSTRSKFHVTAASFFYHTLQLLGDMKS